MITKKVKEAIKMEDKSNVNIFLEAAEKVSKYQKKIAALHAKHNMPVEEELASEEALDVREWKEIENEALGCLKNKGDIAFGILIDVGEGDYGNKTYTLESKPGELQSLYGSTVLDKKMSKVKVGDMVRITVLGVKQGKRREYNDYKVEVKKWSATI